MSWYVQEVHPRASQAIDRVVIVQKRLLFLAPLGLGRQHADIVDPVGTRFQTDDLDVFVAQLEGEGLCLGHQVGRCRNVTEDVGINPGHIGQRVLLHLVLVVVRGEHIVEGEL